MVFKFEGVDSIEEAETLVGSEIQIPAASAPNWKRAPATSATSGCCVVDTRSGRGDRNRCGCKFRGGNGPAADRAQIESGQEFMIPFVESFTKELDLKGKRIEMKLPEGYAGTGRSAQCGEEGSGRQPKAK